MRRYETTFIINPQADDATIDRQVMAVAGLIKADGGQILHERRIGTRRLAYQIGGLVQGFYASIIFDAENTVLPKLERHYKLEEPYVRYLTIRFDGPVPSAADEDEHKSRGEQARSRPAPAAEKPAPSAADETVKEPAAEPVPEERESKAPAEEEPSKTPVEEEPGEVIAVPKATPTEPSDPADEEL